MFKDRSIVAKVVKDSDLSENQESEYHSPPTISHFAVMLDDAARNVAILIGTYFVGDTIRKCIIHTVTTRVK